MDDLQRVKSELIEAKTTIKHLLKEIDDIKLKSEEIKDLNVSIRELALNLKYIVEENKKQSERLQKLEEEPVHNYKKFKILITTTILSAVMTLIIGVLLGTNSIISNSHKTAIILFNLMEVL